jgi:hypothetical protein
MSQSCVQLSATSPAFRFGKLREFPRAGRREPNPALASRYADFMPDGERLIGILISSQAATIADEFVIVLNWFEELRQRVPMP